MKDYLLKLKELLLSDISKEELEEKLENYHDSDIADVLETLSEDERLKIYKKISIERLSYIFSYYENVEDYIDEVSPDYAADIIQEMDSNDAADVLNELPDDDKDEIISLMDKEPKNEVLKLDSYNEDEIGSYMSDNYIWVNCDDTVASATAKMIREAGEHDNIFTIYVVDSDGRYYGAIDFKDLIRARKTDNLDDLIKKSYPFFFDTEHMSECINKLKDYSEDSIPILNRNHKIVGVITSDIVIDATEEEIAEDYAKLGGLSEEEDIDESIFASVKKRIPWLIVLLFLGFIVANVTGSFEHVIAAMPVVVFFQSTISDMSGNVGTQSLAVTIRNLSDDESKKKLKKGIFKEIRVGFFNGLIIAVLAFGLVLAYLAIKHQEITPGMGYHLGESVKISGIISLALLCAMTVSNLIGSIFPILLDKMHIDPAVASGPFITTVNDIVAVLTYYGLVYLFFIL